MPPYLSELNTRQYEAATHTDGPLMIIAGAGAGKTKTITHRIRHLIEQGAAPEEILAVTFTNKAAREMRERVAALLAQYPARGGVEGTPVVSTFHSLGVRILRANAERLSLPKHFSIFDRADSMRLIKQAMKDAGLPEKQFEPKTLLGTISKQKGDGRALREYKEHARGAYYPTIISEVWEHYERALKKEKAVDFDDLLIKTLELLVEHAEVRAHYQHRFKYIHIDEYQDTNKVQLRIAQILAEKHKNICVVGDIDQNIYSWRGASIDNMLEFESHFPNATVVVLEENYRSTKTIVHISNKIIERNLKRKEKTVFTNNSDGEPISLFSAYDEQDEAQFVAQTIAKLRDEGVSMKQIAVLYRANFQSRVIEEALLHTDIPYKVLGTRFFDRKEVKDTLSYLRAASNREGLGDIQRIANVPARGIGKVTLLKMLANKVDELPARTREKVAAFYKILDTLEEKMNTEPPSEVIKSALSLSGYTDALDPRKEEDAERIENLRELVTLASKYDEYPEGEGVTALLEHAALETDQDRIDEGSEAVTLMTVHAAKGLEFNYVFVTGLEEGLFPYERLGDSGADDEEERRLFYVAITRAAEKLYLSHAGVRTIFGSKQVTLPSQFLADIDEDFLMYEERPESLGRVIYLE